MNQVIAVVKNNEQIAENVYRITFKAKAIAEQAKPGQFIMVQVNQSLNPLLRRPFSIHQTITNQDIQVLYKVVGQGTKILSKSKAGDKLDLLGPLGKGFSLEKSMVNCCLIGGGMGIAPLLFLAKKLISLNKPRNIKVLLGSQNFNELKDILTSFTALGLDTSHATDDGSSGHKGFIVEIMANSLLEKDNKHPWNIFCCGPHPMMKRVVDIANQYEWPCQVSMETMMACGISACLGCTIAGKDTNEKGGKYLHVCQEGPVFRADDIQW